MQPRAVSNVQDPTLCQSVPNDKSFLAPRMEALSPDPHRKHRVRSANTKLPLINRPHAWVQSFSVRTKATFPHKHHAHA